MHKTSKLPGRKGRKWIVFSLECYEGLCTDDELCACYPLLLRGGAERQRGRASESRAAGRATSGCDFPRGSERQPREDDRKSQSPGMCNSFNMVNVAREFKTSSTRMWVFDLSASALSLTVGVSAGDQQDSGGEGPGLAAEEEARLRRGGQSVVEEPGAVRGAHPHRPPGQADGDRQGPRA